MTTEPAAVISPPAHPLPELATFELTRYRRDLEHALAALPGQAPARGLLQGKLAEVLAEQDSRTEIITRSRPVPDGASASPPAAGSHAAGPGGLSRHLNPDGL
jgi:hypothetical protein